MKKRMDVEESVLRVLYVREQSFPQAGAEMNEIEVANIEVCVCVLKRVLRHLIERQLVTHKAGLYFITPLGQARYERQVLPWE